MNSDMDKWLAYRNLLCAEDHLSELIARAESPEEKSALEGQLQLVVYLRDAIMPPEADSRYHCYTKHLSIAYEALREAYKGSTSLQEGDILSMAYDAVIWALEKLWGRKINTCERCTGGKHATGRIQEESGGSTAETAISGDTTGIIQGGSRDRIPSILSGETVVIGGTEMHQAESDASRAVREDPFL